MSIGTEGVRAGIYISHSPTPVRITAVSEGRSNDRFAEKTTRRSEVLGEGDENSFPSWTLKTGLMKVISCMRILRQHRILRTIRTERFCR